MDRNLRIVFLVTLTAVMGVASITPAFPDIAVRLKINSGRIGLLITVFTLPGILCAPFLGILADRYGRSIVLVPSLFLFALAGGACAFSRDFNVLLMLRFLQGVGAASLASLSMTLISDLLPIERFNEAMGYNSAVLSISAASYPAIGGLMAGLGWNIPFLLPLTAIPIGVMVIIFLKNPEPKNRQLLSLYLKTTLTALVRREVIFLFITILAAFTILYGSFLTYFPFLLKENFKTGTVAIGLMMSGMSVFSALVSSQLGRLSRKFREKHLLLFGFVCYAVAVISMPMMSGFFWTAIPTALFGCANGLVIPTSLGLTAKLAPPGNRAVFLAVNGMVLRMGQTLGPLVTGFFFALFGLKGAFFAGGATAVLMVMLTAALTAAGRKNHPPAAGK